MKTRKSHKDNMKLNIYELLYSLIEQDEKMQEIVGKLPQNLRKYEVPVLFKKNSTVIMKYERVHFAYVTLLGELYVQSEFADGNIYQFSSMGRGSYIADLEVLSEMHMNAVTVIAAEDTYALQFPVSIFAKELRENHDFLYQVASSLAKKMFASSFNRGKNLYKPGIVKLILFLIGYYETNCLDKDTVKVMKTREEIACVLGTTVRTVNRSLLELKKEEKIQIEKGKIRIDRRQYEELLILADFDN